MWIPLLLFYSIYVSLVDGEPDMTHVGTISILENVTSVGSIEAITYNVSAIGGSGNISSTAVNTTKEDCIRGSDCQTENKDEEEDDYEDTNGGEEQNKDEDEDKIIVEGGNEGDNGGGDEDEINGNGEGDDVDGEGDGEGEGESHVEGENEGNEMESDTSTNSSSSIAEEAGDTNTVFSPSSVPSLAPTMALGSAQIMTEPTLRPTAAQLLRPTENNDFSQSTVDVNRPDQTVYIVFALLLFLLVPTVIGLSTLFKCFSKTYIASVETCYEDQVKSHNHEEDLCNSYYLKGERRSVPVSHGLIPAVIRDKGKTTRRKTSDMGKGGENGDLWTSIKRMCLPSCQTRGVNNGTVLGDTTGDGVESNIKGERLTTVHFASPHDWSSECAQHTHNRYTTESHITTASTERYSHDPYTSDDEPNRDCFRIEDVEDNLADPVESVQGRHNSLQNSHRPDHGTHVNRNRVTMPATPTHALQYIVASMFSWQPLRCSEEANVGELQENPNRWRLGAAGCTLPGGT